MYTTPAKDVVLPVETFLCDITVIALTKTDALKLKNGQPIDYKEFNSTNNIYAGCLNNKLIALVERKENKLFPIRVFNL